MPRPWRDLSGAGALELAAAPLAPPSTALLLGRGSGCAFRFGELRALTQLSRIAVAAEMSALAGRSSRVPALVPDSA